MKMNLYDKFILLFVNKIAGFGLLYLFLTNILPENDNWKMKLVIIVLSLCILYITVRLAISVIEDLFKVKNEDKK